MSPRARKSTGKATSKRKTAKKKKAAPKPKKATGKAGTTPNNKRRFAMADADRCVKIIDVLKKEYPDAHCQLDFNSGFELLIATILAAQCTDVMVNRVTPELFAKYPDPQSFVDANPEDIEKMIFKTGFYRNKTKSIQKCCKSLLDEYDGVVPRTMKELTALAGVGRKTANCILGNVFEIPGVVVDTHVKRISNRMGFTVESNPDKIEFNLMDIVPKDDWIIFSHLITDHGRAICDARKPLCDECPVEHLCPKIM